MGEELKQTAIAKKQYQGLHKAFISTKNNKNVNESLIKTEKPTVKKYNNKSNLIYNRLSFYSYSDDEKFDSFSFKSKYLYPLNFYDLEKLIKMKPTNLSKTTEKENVYNTVSKLYNKRFENYCDEYYELSDVSENKLDQKFNRINLKLKDYDYDEWFTEEELDDEKALDDLPPLEK